MKLFRFDPSGRERPGAIDGNGIARDISSAYEDLGGEALLPSKLEKLKRADSLPPVPACDRLGSCIGGTRNFIAIGLNGADHAEEAGAAIQSEPKMSIVLGVLAIGIALLVPENWRGTVHTAEVQDGTVYVPAFPLPRSGLLSSETHDILARVAKEREELKNIGDTAWGHWDCLLKGFVSVCYFS